MENASSFISTTETTETVTTVTEGQEMKTDVPGSVMFGVSSFLIIFANTLTLVVLYRASKCFEEIPRFIFQALAVTDVLTGIFCCGFSFLFSLAPHLQNPVTCALRTMSCTGCLCLSAMTLAFATLDRYIAITRPLRYHTIITMKRARIVIATLAVVAILNALFTNVGADRNPNIKMCISDLSAVGIGIPFRPSFLVILFIFYTSLIIATIANYKVVRVAVHHSERVGVADPNGTSEPPPPSTAASNPDLQPARTNRLRLRSLWTVLIATVLFYVAVMPWTIMASLLLAKHINVPHSIRIVAAYLLVNNSWWNAVVYFLISKTFRKAVKRTLLGCCSTGSSSDSDTVTANSFISEGFKVQPQKGPDDLPYQVNDPL